MKLIEALKKIKDLQRKADDIRELVKQHCAISTLETPTFENQYEKVNGWIQSHSDLLKEILRLRVCIQRTNLDTQVTIEFENGKATKSIAEWIHRRRDLAGEELKMWAGLSDRGIREGDTQGPGGTIVNIKIVRYYDPDRTFEMRSSLKSEPMTIDSTLEVTNAVTDLIE
jgi:hypothetical protein